MSHSSIRFAIAIIFALLSISITTNASAASYKKCFKRWAIGYDKTASMAMANAIASWNAKAQAYLSLPGANWAASSNKQRFVSNVIHNGKKTRKAGVFGTLCKNNAPSTTRNPGAGRTSRMPSLRFR